MRIGIFATLCVLIASCSNETTPRNTGVYMLLDTSGTYAEELTKAEQIIRFTLSKLDAADSFAVARIDTGSIINIKHPCSFLQPMNIFPLLNVSPSPCPRHYLGVWLLWLLLTSVFTPFQLLSVAPYILISCLPSLFRISQTGRDNPCLCRDVCVPEPHR